MHSYHHNPVHNAVVNLKAREYSNMKIGVWNKRTDTLEPRSSKKPAVMKLYKLWDRPNCTQSTWEFLQQWKIFYETCGNSFSYANSPIGFEPTFETIQALWNPWPEYMSYQLTGKYFEATEMADIVKNWKFEYGKYKKEWDPKEIFHRNRPNTKVQDGLIFGQSAAEPLYRPLSNIQMAYESRNVIMKNRGMRAIISSAAGDATGRIPLQPNEKEEVNVQIKDYGMLEGQNQFFFSNYPLDVKTFDQDVSKLGLFEEIATDAMIVAIAHGVPEVLLKLYLKGTTFENQEASVRRLYQGALIPEALDDMMAWSSFLGLDDTDFCLVPLFDHIVALQESEERKAKVDQSKKETAMKEFASNIITLDEYRKMMGYGPKPVPVEDPNSPKAENGADTKTLESQAELRGSVGGVTGLIAVQTSVSQGVTTYDAGIAILTIVYGFTPAQATDLLGDPKPAAAPATV